MLRGLPNEGVGLEGDAQGLVGGLDIGRLFWVGADLQGPVDVGTSILNPIRPGSRAISARSPFPVGPPGRKRRRAAKSFAA